MMVCPTILVNTFFDTKLDVGLFGTIRWYGKVLPTVKQKQTWFSYQY
jgi:hypothetical protein